MLIFTMSTRYQLGTAFIFLIFVESFHCRGKGFFSLAEYKTASKNNFGLSNLLKEPLLFPTSCNRGILMTHFLKRADFSKTKWVGGSITTNNAIKSW